jgi:hypothetical protein
MEDTHLQCIDYIQNVSSFGKQKEAGSKQYMKTINDAINLKLDVVTQQEKKRENCNETKDSNRPVTCHLNWAF